MTLAELGFALTFVAQDWDVCLGWYALGASHEASCPRSIRGHLCGARTGGCTLCQQVEQRTSAVLLQVHPGEYTPAQALQAAMQFWQVFGPCHFPREQQHA